MQILSVPVIILLLLWKSEGVTIADLNRDDVNYRNTLYGFIGIGALSCIYSVGVATVGLAGMKLPALLVHSLGFYRIFTFNDARRLLLKSLCRINRRFRITWAHKLHI